MIDYRPIRKWLQPEGVFLSACGLEVRREVPDIQSITACAKARRKQAGGNEAEIDGKKPGICISG